MSSFSPRGITRSFVAQTLIFTGAASSAYWIPEPPAAGAALGGFLALTAYTFIGECKPRKWVQKIAGAAITAGGGALGIGLIKVHTASILALFGGAAIGAAVTYSDRLWQCCYPTSLGEQYTGLELEDGQPRVF
jgi:hypothetical protein